MKKPYYKKEIYTDEYESLVQSIIFKVGDYRNASYLRSEINPNLTILKAEIYLDENMKPIKEEIR